MAVGKKRRTTKSGFGYDIITKAPSGARPIKPSRKVYPATMRGNAVYHKACGGQVMVDAAIYGLKDFGFGFRGSKFQVERTYGKKPIGYRGQCLGCGKRGAFIFKK